MDNVSSIISAVGGLTVLTTIQQVITGMLDERRKSAEAKRTRRREPLDRRHQELGNLSEAEALAERQNIRLGRQVEHLQLELDKRDQAIKQRDAEILRQRAEIAQLYQEIYRSSRRPPTGSPP